MKSNSSPFKFVLAAALLQVAASSQKFTEPYSSDYEVKAEIKGEDTNGADDYDMSGMNAPANVYQPDASGEEIEPASGSYEGAYGGYNNKPLRRKKCRSKPSEYPAPEPEYTPAEVTETPYTTEVEPEIYTPAEVTKTPYTTGVEPVPEEKTPCPQKTEIEPTDMPQATYTPEYAEYPDPENYPEPDHTTEIAATPDESLYSSDAIKLTNMGLLAILGFFF